MCGDVSVDDFKGKCVTASPKKSWKNGDKNKGASK